MLNGEKKHLSIERVFVAHTGASDTDSARVSRVADKGQRTPATDRLVLAPRVDVHRKTSFIRHGGALYGAR